MQILEIPAQRKFISLVCHAHSSANNPTKTVGFNARIKFLNEMYGSYQYLSFDQKKRFATLTLIL